eukprot:scaffold3091_cov36-Tisochrysis_lutea.AAC.1
MWHVAAQTAESGRSLAAFVQACDTCIRAAAHIPPPVGRDEANRREATHSGRAIPPGQRRPARALGASTREYIRHAQPQHARTLCPLLTPQIRSMLSDCEPPPPNPAATLARVPSSALPLPRPVPSNSPLMERERQSSECSLKLSATTVRLHRSHCTRCSAWRSGR